MFEAVSALTEKRVWRAFDAKTLPWTWSVAPRPELVPTPTGPPMEYVPLQRIKNASFDDERAGSVRLELDPVESRFLIVIELVLE